MKNDTSIENPEWDPSALQLTSQVTERTGALARAGADLLAQGVRLSLAQHILSWDVLCQHTVATSALILHSQRIHTSFEKGLDATGPSSSSPLI